MLRLWRDRLRVSLAPESIAIARVAGGQPAKITFKKVVEADPAFGPESWHGAVSALAAAAEPLRAERVSVTVVLSNHFVRYAVVPFDMGVTGPEEELALARFHFTRIHGDRAKDWDLRLSGGPHGTARLASAVDAGLIQGIRACFPLEAKARLESVQPYLMSAFNRWHGTAATKDAWLMLVEPHQSCLSLFARRSWTTVQTFRGEYLDPADWAALLDLQQLRAEGATGPDTVLVHAPSSRRVIAGKTAGWKFLGLTLPPLEGFVPIEDSRLAMALTSQ